MLAGIALLVLAFMTLWRTRRREGGLLRRSLRRAAIGVAALVVGFSILYPLGYAYVGTHVARPPVDDIELGSGNVEAVELHTSDGLTLEGSYVPSRNGAAVIVAFGRKGTQRPARMLARHGYGVLIFDRRGEGESGGDPTPTPGTRASSTCSRRSTSSSAAPTSSPVASVGSACPSAARRSSRLPRTAATCKPWSPRAPARAPRGSLPACPAAPPASWPSTRW